MLISDKLSAAARSLIESYHADTFPFLVKPTYFPNISIRNNLDVTDDNMWRSLFFPEYFNSTCLFPRDNPITVESSLHLMAQNLYCNILPRLIAFNYEAGLGPFDEDERTSAAVEMLVKSLGEIRENLKLDIKAAREGDPAAKAIVEIIHHYPGFRAILTYRIAHILYQQAIPIFPRMLSEAIHSCTGIDIHPGAQIGQYFFIDHGTGVVIGETTEIGNHVRIYQKVTLGALSLPPEKVEIQRQSREKRHPTIDDCVTIYAGATILGGETIVGHHSIIGGNVWLTKSVPPYTRVYLEEPPYQRISCFNSSGLLK